MASLREQLVGAWELASYALIATGGTDRVYPWGQEPRGTILYSACGYMSAQIMRPGRPKFASGDWLSGTPEEYREQSTGYIAYTGRFETDEHRNVVKHHVVVSLFPNWEGLVQVRTARIESDRLFLSTESPLSIGHTWYMAELAWRRVRPIS